MLRLENIHTSYGPIKAIRGSDMEIRRGEIVSLIGSNGAGKSTCLMTISGILTPSEGSILLENRDISICCTGTGRIMAEGRLRGLSFREGTRTL